MGEIVFSGLSTGIDTASLIKALVEAKRQPITILQKQVDGFQTRVTRLDEFAAKVTALRTAVTGLTWATSFAAYTATSSNTSVVTVTASSAASEGNHTIVVSSLAKNQTTVGTPAQTIAATDVAAGLSGTLVLTPTNGPSFQVTVSASDTLETIRDAINNVSVKAFGTVTFGGVPVNGTTLTVDGVTYEFTTGTPSGTNVKVDTTGLTTGAQAASALAAAATGGGKGPNSTMTANGAVVTVAADTAGSGGNSIAMSEASDTGNAISLSGKTLAGGGSPPYAASLLNTGTAGSPSYTLVLTAKNGGTANGFTATGLSGITFANSQTAQDAVFTVDGIAGIHRSSNIVSDVITGVTFTLVDAPATSPSIGVTVGKDVSSVRTKIQSFLTSYNELKTYITANTKFDPVSKTGGDLMGETAVSTVATGLSTLIVGEVPGLSGSYTALSRVGITTSSDGTLTMDTSKLDAAMGADFQAVVNLFARNLSTGTQGVAYRIQDKIDQWMSSVDGIISVRKSGLQSTMLRMSDSIAQKESAVAEYEVALKLQYARLEQLVSTLKDQSGALSRIGVY
jgi:flagellar hook-associated protein 2